MALTSAQSTAAQLVLAYLGRGTDVATLQSYAANFVNGVPTASQLSTLFASAEAQGVFGATPTLSSVIYKSFELIGRTPTTQQAADWVNWATSQNFSLAQLPWEILKAGLATESSYAANQQVLWARTALAYKYAEDVSANPAAVQALASSATAQANARALISAATDVTTAQAIYNGTGTVTIAGSISNIANQSGQTFMLTNGRDVVTANIFESHNVLVNGSGYVNTLADNDVLTGAGTNPTLNVELGASNDISDNGVVQPTLNGIQTVNVQWISNDQTELNFADATGLTTLNVERITANNATVKHSDLDSTVTTLSLSNATRGGTVEFNYREEVLTGTNEVLNAALNSIRVNDLKLQEGTDGGADAGFFFEDVNLTTTGNNDVDAMTVQANGREDLLNSLAAGTTRQSLDIVANGTVATGSLEINALTAAGVDTMSIVANARVDIAKDKLVALDDSNDGISTADLETLTITGAANVMIDGLDTTKQTVANGQKTLTVDAGAMTGNLKLGVATAADAEVSTVYANRADEDLRVTSGSGNDEIRTYGGLAGDITTNAGNDTVAVRDENNDVNANVEGVSQIVTGAGNDTVSAANLGVTATDSDQLSNAGFDDVTAASISTGDDNDTVTVAVMQSGRDFDNYVLTDTNNDDHYVQVGSSVNLGNGTNGITLTQMQENTTVTGGTGVDTVNVELSVATVMAADTDADIVALTTSAATASRTREVSGAGLTTAAGDDVVDRLGAVIDLGDGNDVANFADTTSGATLAVTIVARDAELRGGVGSDTLNVTALDDTTVTVSTSTVDQDVVTANVQNDLNANVTGVETANFTISNQIDAVTAAATNTTENDNVENDGAVIADVMRFDNSLAAINLVSQEQVLLQNPDTEVYEAGTKTTFTLDNLRSGVALSLQANEATGVLGAVAAGARTGSLRDDTQLTINTTTGEVNAAVTDADVGADAADVTLNLNYDNARGLTDSAALNVAAASGAFDLDLNIGATLTDTLDTDGDGNSATVANGVSATDDDTMRIENFTVNFADANSHSIDANGFGDVVFRGVNDRPAAVAGDVSSTAVTSFTVNSAAGAGETIAIDAVNADTIAVNNAAGTAVTAANVTLRVDASNNYTITTGSGTDVLDMRADDVRSDDIATALNRADNINAGTGRDTMIVNGADNLGVNDNIEGGVASTIIDDDVFATIRSVEKILVDGDFNAGAESLDITLDEQAKVTGVDTVALVGTEQQTLNLEVGNNFELATTADNANGELTTATAALVVDASLHTGQTLLNIESKDDDTDVQVINMDVRVDSDGGTILNIVNSGDVAAQYEVRVYTADENDTHTISSANAGNADGLVDINVTTGSFDKLVVLEGENANAGGAEGAMTIALDAGWTGTTFTVDASAVLDTDAGTATGGATITAALGDTAVLTIDGTQNNDTIVGGRGADTINGNAGDDTITGDEVIDQNELEVVTFAATYDAGDVVTVTHNGNTMTATITVDGVTGAVVAAAMAAYDLAGADGIAGDNITTAGAQFAVATSAADAPTRQLRLTGATAGTDYVVTAATDNTLDNVAQVQTLTINAFAPVPGGGSDETENVQVVWNGITYTIATVTESTGPDAVTRAAGAQLGAFAAAVTAAGGTVDSTNLVATGVVTVTGAATGVAFPLITQVLFNDGADAGIRTTATLSLAAGDVGTDQANPGVVTETMARTVVGGADTINGGTGNDTIAGLTGADILNGGDGVDTLDYSLSLGGVTVNLAANTAAGGDAAGDTISNFESVTGSAYDDVLTGSAVDNVLNGGVGNDTLSGAAGADTLLGGAGADTLTGGTGNDTVNLGVDAVEDIVIVASGDGVDSVLNFTAGTDTIRFSDFADRDLLPASLLQQTAAAGGGADNISGANTELLVVTGNTLMLTADITTANVATVLDAEFNVSDATGRLADGKVVFAIQIDTDGAAGADSTVFGYYTDVGTDDSVAAADIEIIGVATGSLLTSADFWLPTV